MLYAIVAVLVIIADQAVKYLSLLYIGGKDGVMALIPNVLSLVYVENRGAAFSLLAGSNARIFFIILTGVFTLAVIIALATNFISGRFGRWCMVIVTAGGLSNCIDRVIYGYVQDMFKVELFDFAVFNLADVFITVFCLLFIIYILFGGEKDRAEEDYDEFDEEDSEEEDKRRLFKKRSLDDEDDVPVKPARKKSKRRLDDDDDDDYVPPKKSVAQPARQTTPPVRRPASADVSRTPAQPQRVARPTTVPGTATTVKTPTSAPAYDPTDPFAEWERASARVAAQGSGEVAKVMGVEPAKQAPARPIIPVVPPAKSAPATPAAKKPSSSSDFDLDDILDEFK